MLLITGGRLGDSFGRHRVFRAGISVFVMASLGCALAPAPSVLIGLGGGLFTTSFCTAALQPLSPEDNGLAAGQLNAAQQLGATLGVATMGRAYLHTNHLTAPLLLAIGVALGVMLLRRLPDPVPV